MLIRNALQLLGGLLLFSASQASAWASHDYKINITTSGFDLSQFYVKILPPEGYAPNSSCMETWQVPSREVRLNTSTPTQTVTIKDKDSATCSGNAKYNTWKYEIWRYPFTSYPYERQVGQGSFQFVHQKVYGDWTTMIIPRNLDGIPRGSPAVGMAVCYSNKNVGNNCLLRDVKGKDSADTIKIYFRWPVNENYSLF